MLHTNTVSLYRILELTKNATPVEIKAQYRRLAKRCHPDMIKFHGDPKSLLVAEERFKHINYAYETLSNPERRREYDQTHNEYTFSASSWPLSTDAPTESSIQPHLQLTSDDDRRLQEAWQAFISRPFGWSEGMLRFYQRCEWVFGIATLPVFVLLFTGKITTLSIFEFLLTSSSSPVIENDIPVYGMTLGVMCAFVLTFIVTLHAIVTHWYSCRRNQDFRYQLLNLSLNMLAVSGVIFGVVGLVVGHYFF